MRKLSTAAFLAAALTLAVSAQGQARTFTFQGPTAMLGANEPNAAGQLGQGDPDGIATGTVTLDPNADTVTWDFNYSNISGAAISGFHIHGPGATPTTNVGIIIGFPLSSTTVPNGTQTGTLMPGGSVTDLGTKIDQVLANPSQFYINLHSSGAGGFPGGAVRATLPEPTALALLGITALGLLRRRRTR